MELSLPSLSQGTPAASLASSSGRAAAKQLYDHGGGGRWRRRRMRRAGFGGAAGPLPQVRCGKSSAERNGGGIDASREREGAGGGRFTGPAMEVTTFDRGFGDSEFPIWEKIGAVVRLSYGIGIYGAMALAGRFICSFTGIDCTGGFHPSLDAIVGGLGYAIPPIMALLFILDDEVVKLSPHARAIRDVEDEELWSFFYGMSPWQFILIVAASSIGEELFYRAAIQVCSYGKMPFRLYIWI
ncbi:hypothetical protein EUGRSUZ_D02191 [Eucalyptus grandis]|uniref:Uncharacterized protein n=2 Tax=Eucalyptus grandis TaxID=71139 RepID=A0ACC3L833_EUCGR|nr:hypothetical protein EUGRSUZ_D02191 [Eucalyptus grandis]